MRLAVDLVKCRRVDAIKDIAEAYPLSVFPAAVGLEPEGLENLLPYGTMVFDAFGPRNKHFEASMARAAEVVGWIIDQCARENLSPNGLGATIWAAADTGEIKRKQIHCWCAHYSTGLDTTIIAIGNGLYGLAANPDQWKALRDNPSIIRSAFDEMLRSEIAGPDLLSHDDSRGRTRWRKSPAELENLTVPRRRQPRSPPLGGPDALRRRSQGERPCRIRRGHSHVRRTDARPARNPRWCSRR